MDGLFRWGVSRHRNTAAAAVGREARNRDAAPVAPILVNKSAECRERTKILTPAC